MESYKNKNKKLKAGLALPLATLFAIFVITTLNAADVPLPYKNPYNTGAYIENIKAMDMPISSRQRLFQVQNPSIRDAILKATQGRCPSTFSVKGTETKVEHAKQCGRSADEKKKRNGHRCNASGIEGGTIEAMCVNGCCVALGVNYDNGNPGQNFGKQGTDPFGMGQTGGGGMSAFSQMLPQFLQQMMQGGGGGGGSYEYPGSEYKYPSTSTSTTKTTVNTKKTTNTKYTEKGATDTEELNNNQTNKENKKQTEHTNTGTSANEDSIRTILTKSGKKVEIKVGKPEGPGRYAFVPQNNPNEIADTTTQKEKVIRRNTNKEEEILNLETRTKVDIKRDPSSTGFKGEQVGRVREPSLWEKLSIWLTGLLGLR